MDWIPLVRRQLQLGPALYQGLSWEGGYKGDELNFSPSPERSVVLRFGTIAAQFQRWQNLSQKYKW